MLRIGVDVGGTFTDAVLLEGHEILETAKVPTSPDVTVGVSEAIRSLLTRRATCGSRLRHVAVGSTHLVNAVLQQRGLAKVAVLRLGAPCSEGLPPLSQFPPALAEAVRGPWAVVKGGVNLDGRPITQLDEDEVKDFARRAAASGRRRFAIVGIFSPVCPEQELQAAEWVLQVCPDASLSLSHQLGQLDLLTRENVSILNEALKPLARRTVAALDATMRALGLEKTALYLTQNNGTLLALTECLAFPVLTFNSGTTNSMRGAAFLCGEEASAWPQAIVVDIGGTSTDAGLLLHGFPKPAPARVLVGGVPTNFRAPELVSVALGGGSVVTWSEDDAQVGPASVALQLSSRALVFGGDVTTFTDVAVANDPSITDIGRRDLVAHLTEQDVASAMRVARQRLETVVEGVRVSAEVVPLVLVGGGAALFAKEEHVAGLSIFRPPHAAVANAVGAALAKVSASCDKICDLGQDRTGVLLRTEEELQLQVVKLGANPSSLFLAEKEEIALAYLPGARVRLRMRVIGDLAPQERSLESAAQGSALDLPVDEEEVKVEGVASAVGSGDDETAEDGWPEVKDGVWRLGKFDLSCLALGTIFLGCGGGGDPEPLLLRLRYCLDNDQTIRVISPDALERTAPNSMVHSSMLMGSPLVAVEKLSSDLQQWAVVMGQLAEPYMCRELETKEEGVFRASLDQLKDILSVKGTSKEPWSNCAFVTFEIGGLNGLTPLLLSAQTGCPIVDADFMGRAFPELQMTTADMAGHCAAPSVLGDEFGTCLISRKHRTAKELESFFRKECVALGCTASIAFSPLTPTQVKEFAVQHSLSRAWHIGREILQQRRCKGDAGEALRRLLNGQLLIEGKIIDVQLANTDAFARGDFLVRGKTGHLSVHLQNEFLLARTSDCANRKDGQVLATTPDFIVVLDSSSGQPLQTSDIRYGLAIRVYAFPAPPQLTTERALKVVGPSAFGLEDVEFKSVGAFVELPPVA